MKKNSSNSDNADFVKVLCSQIIKVYNLEISVENFKLQSQEYNGYGYYFYFQKILNLPKATYNSITFTTDKNLLCGVIMWVDDEQVLVELYPFGDGQIPQQFTVKSFNLPDKK
jgi:hypothetical protein